MAVVVALQVLFTYAPFMNVAFGTASLTGRSGPSSSAIGVGAMVVMDLVGVVLRRLRID